MGWALYQTGMPVPEEVGAAVSESGAEVVFCTQSETSTGVVADIEALKPVEGATGWSDTWMLSTKAAHPNCMKLWMDWITSPWANAQVAEWFGEAPANRESCALTANPDQCSVFHADETEYWQDVWYWTTATEECRDGRTDVTCVPYSEWINACNELRS